MADMHDTIDGLLAEMRDEAARADMEQGYSLDDAAEMMREFAWRFDAAHKHERETADAKITDLQSRVKLWTDRSAELVKKCDEQYAKLKQVGNAAKLREAISNMRTALKEIRDDVLDMVMNYKSEDPDSYAHGLCLSIGGACDMALNSTKEFDNAD